MIADYICFHIFSTKYSASKQIVMAIMEISFGLHVIEIIFFKIHFYEQLLHFQRKNC